jgi:serine phosphatase RsbU (regulator of sigma subunit)/anti-sigma regulatory factor (Ser/Thr protein kinase)
LNIRLPARLDSLDKAMEFIADRARPVGWTPQRVRQIQLVAEEALVNIIHYAYPGRDGTFELRWPEKAEAKKQILEIEDEGNPFNILDAPETDLEAGLLERKVGGLGIHFIKTLADGVSYRREGFKNILTFVFDRHETARGEHGSRETTKTADGLNLPLAYMKKESFRKGDILFRSGDVADKMYYVVRGIIRLVEIDKLVKAGGVIGEMGILSPFQTRMATAVCEEDLDVYAISKDDVIKLFIQDSSLAFDLVQLCIKRYTENLKAETEAKERMLSELRIAHDIQVGMLPRVFPPFPDRTEFEIFATMEPAKEVGGDFYDFFLIDQNRLGVVIGDVSGKGIPAALFMAICKTLLKTEALRGLPPADVLERVNRLLIPDNEMMMFVTVFLVVLDVRTGEIKYADGGHPPPLISTPSGEVRFLEVPTGLILGAKEGVRFGTAARTMTPGDIMILYSDGVTEAMNRDHELFSEDRLKRHLLQSRERDPVRLVPEIRDRIRTFAGGAAQWDDITMVALKYNGPGDPPGGAD